MEAQNEELRKLTSGRIQGHVRLPLLPGPDNATLPSWHRAGSSGRHSPFSDDAFSVIDDLDEQERSKIVQDYFEGPKTCQCCINWIEGVPNGLQEEKDEDEDEEGGPPIVIRRTRNGGGPNPFTIFAIEIKSAAMRDVLSDVFRGFDGMLPGLKYLTFLAPFRQFFYRWDEFEQAIKDCENDALVNSLKVLRGVVKGQLKEAFTVSKDMISHGVITFEYLWTLFKPGDLVYNRSMSGNDQIFQIRAISLGPMNFRMTCQFVDWNGTTFGFIDNMLEVHFFPGTKKIASDLEVYPIGHHEDIVGLTERLIIRGERFRDLVGVHYKSYKEHESQGGMKSLTRQVSNSSGHPFHFPL